MAAAIKIIRAKLVRRGFADADRIRHHFRRCDDWKGCKHRNIDHITTPHHTTPHHICWMHV